jgi:aminopeptidase N
MGNRDVFFNDWKDSDMYYKGTWMLHSFRYFLDNDSIWFKILKEIGMNFGHRPVSSKELIAWITRRTNPSAETFFSQYLTRLNWPVLEYRLAENAGKKVLSFQWKAEEANFQSAVPLQINGKTIRLEATSAWKEMELTEPNPLISANEEWFLYKLKMVP